MKYCGLCKKVIHFWQRNIFSEFDMYGAAEGEVHLRCHILMRNKNEI